MWSFKVNSPPQNMGETSFTLNLEESDRETQEVDSSVNLSDLDQSQKPSEISNSGKTTPTEELSQVTPTKKYKKTPPTKPTISSSSQKKKYTKRSKKIMEKKLQSIINNCDDLEMLHDLVVKTMNAKKSHTKSKETKNDFVEQKISTESPTLAATKRDHSVAKLTSLQEIEMKYVEDLFTVHNDQFKEMIINKLIAKLNASRVLELFKIEEIKEFILKMNNSSSFLELFKMEEIKEFIVKMNNASSFLELFKLEEIKEVLCTKNSSDLYDLLISDRPAIEKVLKRAPDDVIINLVESRVELKRSQTLLDLLIKNFSHRDPDEDLNSNIDNNVTVKSESAVESAIANLVKCRKEFNNDSCLLDVMLQNGPEVLSEENKKNLKTFLLKKCSPHEFLNLSYEVSAFHIPKKENVTIQFDEKTEKNISLIEID